MKLLITFRHLIDRVARTLLLAAVSSLTWNGCLVDQARADQLDWICLSDNGEHFVLGATGQPFVPWGFNYDHDRKGRLLEDYWVDEWSRVESDFREMKQLGANVVRIHLQFGKFMAGPGESRQGALNRLGHLIDLAERTGLYIDLTGLGCYHKQDVPRWYDVLSEKDRWSAQACFWEAIAKACRDSPAVFCFDLMNEPVVAGGDGKRESWLGPAFGGKHFVQFITRDRGSRDRAEVARRWTQLLVSAIRKHDRRHLITVGLVPWSLDRPGLTSGFVPQKIADEIDFLAVHLYPEQGKLESAIQTLEQFAAVGKPVLIEETFPLKCDIATLEQFFERSRKYASGWIGFYWGTTPDELRPAQSISEQLTLSWLQWFESKQQPTVCR